MYIYGAILLVNVIMGAYAVAVMEETAAGAVFYWFASLNSFIAGVGIGLHLLNQKR